MKVEFYPMEKQGRDFYGLMGPHFASFDHKKELGGWQLYNKDDSIWVILFEDKQIIGFCSFFKNKTYYYLDNFMILKEYRNKKSSLFLMEEALKYDFDIKRIKSMTNNKYMIRVFEKFGFRNAGNRGSYSLYEKSL